MSLRAARTLSGPIKGFIFVPKGQQVRNLTPFGHVPTNNFAWKGMKKHPAVLPLVFIMGGAVVGLVGFSIYSSQTRENVIYNKSTKTLSESMDLLNPRALKAHHIPMYVINPNQYQPKAGIAEKLSAVNSGDVAEEE